MANAPVAPRMVTADPGRAGPGNDINEAQMTPRPAAPMPILAAILALVLPAAGWAQAGPGGPGGPGGLGRPGGPTEVGVMTAARSQVPVTVTLPGRAVAFQQAAITPKVGGEVREVAYEPGSAVTAGTVLFRLEDETIAAQLSADSAAVESAQSAVDGAQATVNRYRRLQGSGVTQVDLENAEVALSSARAQLVGAQAQRDLTQLSLERTEIRSPIDGIADIASVSVGDIVSAGPQTVLTTVTQLDPIYVDVAESRARILRNRERRAEGTLQRVDGPSSRLILETGQVYEHPGYQVSPGIAVSETTGTVPFRIRFANPDRMILPGQFVRVEIQVGQVEGVLVPQRATSRAADGALTAFVVRDGKADQVELTESGTTRNSWIATEGIEAGDLLVLDGLDNLRDGAEVTTVPVVIDDEGVVRDADAETAASDAPTAGAAAGNAPAQPAAAASGAPAAAPAGVPANPVDPNAPTAAAPAQPAGADAAEGGEAPAQPSATGAGAPSVPSAAAAAGTVPASTGTN